MQIQNGKKNFIEEYLDWIRQSSTQIEVNDCVEITTPYLDMHNDFLQIYIKHDKEKYYLTDDGAVIGNLEASGCDVKSPRRRTIIEQIATSLGVRIRDGEICTEASPQNVPQKQHNLLQAMLKIGDVLLTSSTRIKGMFFEEIETYFLDNDVRYSPSILLMGTSGLYHRFDFIVSASKRHPERVITAINTPGKQNIQAALFSWEDTKSTRKKDSKSFIILNDLKKAVGSELITAISNYGITPIPWGDRAKYVDEIAG